MLISNSLKKLLNNAPKKVKSKTSLTNMSKSGNNAYFRHVFAYNFIFSLISTFCKLWLQMRTKRLKKTENLFYECVLEFN
jgi:hypothetical protein